jgi:uncharacterized protein (TIGR00251 family)
MVDKPARLDNQLLHVRVKPLARQSAVAGWHGTTLRVRVRAAPANGEANRAVAELLADTFGVSASAVELVSGARSRDKLFRVGRLCLGDLRARWTDEPA